MLLWVILVLGRFIPSGWNSATQRVEFPEWRDLLAHAILAGILVVASFWQVRTSHAMLLILNSWSASLLGGEISCMQAKQQWRRVSGLFRKTSRTFEHCFAALASLIVAVALSALYDLRQGGAGGAGVGWCGLRADYWLTITYDCFSLFSHWGRAKIYMV